MGLYTGITESYTDKSGIIECKEQSMLAASFNIVRESELNYNNIMKAAGIYEVTSIEENGLLDGEVVWESSQASGFIGKLKAFFLGILEKIKGLFRQFMALIDSYIMSDKDFVKKYKDVLVKVDTKDFEYKGYKYTFTDVPAIGKAYESAVKVAEKYNIKTSDAKTYAGALAGSKKDDDKTFTADVDKVVTAYNSKKNDIIDEMRGAACGKGGKMDSAEFESKVFELLRDGKDTEDTIDKISTSDVTTMLEIISNYKEAKKLAEKNERELKDSTNAIIKELDTMERDLSREIPGEGTSNVNAMKAAAVKYISTTSGSLKDALNIAITLNGKVLAALKQQNRQCKAVCVKLLNYKPKNESAYGESNSYGNDPFSTVQLV